MMLQLCAVNEVALRANISASADSDIINMSEADKGALLIYQVNKKTI